MLKKSRVFVPLTKTLLQSCSIPLTPSWSSLCASLLLVPALPWQTLGSACAIFTLTIATAPPEPNPNLIPNLRSGPGRRNGETLGGGGWVYPECKRALVVVPDIQVWIVVLLVLFPIHSRLLWSTSQYYTPEKDQRVLVFSGCELHSACIGKCARRGEGQTSEQRNCLWSNHLPATNCLLCRRCPSLISYLLFSRKTRSIIVRSGITSVSLDRILKTIIQVRIAGFFCLCWG